MHFRGGEDGGTGQYFLKTSMSRYTLRSSRVSHKYNITQGETQTEHFGARKNSLKCRNIQNHETSVEYQIVTTYILIHKMG